MTAHSGTAVPVAVPTTISRACRIGRNAEAVSSQSGKSCGGRKRPPPKASRNSATCVMAMAALGPEVMPIIAPISIGGSAVTSTRAMAARRRSGSGRALVKTPPTTSSGTIAAVAMTRVARISAPMRESGLAGSVRR
ncbi:MAG: hypothetical protein PGN24_01245 [Microbacterium arborescens]